MDNCKSCENFIDCDIMGEYESCSKITSTPVKTTPCDYPDNEGHYHCPFAYDDDSYVSCRDYCGLGVDE